MLRFLYLTTALIPFLPEVVFGLPLDAQYNPPTAVVDSFSNPNLVIVGPSNRYPTGGAYPLNNFGTVIVNPNNRYSTGGTYPINNFGTVIVNPNNSSTSRHSNCGSSVIGNPIPSPVPVDLYTGRFCR